MRFIGEFQVHLVVLVLLATGVCLIRKNGGEFG